MEASVEPTEKQTDLKTVFDSKLKEQLLELDVVRKEAVKRLVVSLFVVPLSAVLAFLYVEANYMDLEVVLWVAGFVAVMMYLYVGKKWKSYRNGYKTEVVGKLLKMFNDSFKYSPNDCISSQEYKNSGLYQRSYDRYVGEDYVKGMLGKTAIQFSELHTQYKTTSTDSKGNKRTTWHTIFKGLFFIADANKHFNGKTYIMPDSDSIFSSIGKSISSLFGGRGDRVALEDPEFERHFEVYSDDQVEARYLISPALMRRLVSFKYEAGANVALSFVGENLYIAIPTRKAYFEPKLFKPAADFDVVEEIYQDLDFITGIVEDLNLNTRIWTKE